MHRASDWTVAFGGVTIRSMVEVDGSYGEGGATGTLAHVEVRKR